MVFGLVSKIEYRANDRKVKLGAKSYQIWLSKGAEELRIRPSSSLVGLAWH